MKTVRIIFNEFRHFFAWQSILPVTLLMLCVSCGKDDPRPTYEDGYSTVIYDLPGDTDASMGANAEGKEQRDFYTFLFRFRDQRQIWIKTKSDSLQWLKTKEWDIAFTGPYNSEVFLNNANYEFNPGYEGEATNTSVVLLKQSYESVTEAPSDEDFNRSEITKIGWAFSGSSDGWFRYSLSTHIMQALPNRTYVMRLPDGRYAKLQLINAYKGNPPAVSNMNWPAPFYTFRYFVQQDGSKNLNTR